ncbi:TBC1 domain family member 23-like isoform X2 [Tubulanus polymorphus]|uniref:TBC1 domain family member 23-like isoform X2 n=1 Tax=Tubulanus polymorphus TaxID=672921 RepID=UPI003DA5CE31
MSDSDDDSCWSADLESALLEGCDFGILRNICKGRPVPDHLRTDVWKICLNVSGKGDMLSCFDELYDMPEQEQLRLDCHALVENLGNEEEDKVSIISDLESILTFYCKSRNEKYAQSNGWLDIIQPQLALKQNKAELYNMFYAIITKYMPKDCVKNGKVFHLFRLLLLYHDPELCSFLDSKRITPDLYALKWFQSIFAHTCDLKVILVMWDVYFQQADPFLIFFLALVILVNAKEQLLLMKDESKQAIVDTLSLFPCALEAEDIEDFCSLAQYYASRTPQSFRRDYQQPLFGHSIIGNKDESIQVSQALCLPVSVGELLSANQGDRVQYFVVDCRPAEQYNSGHLPTAFHLDLNLMLQNPVEFATAVQALFATKQQAVAAGSIAGGEHLCFMGSGREEEDLYVNMVLANFLQKNTMYVSVARGGYAALHAALKDNLNDGLTDHCARSCIVCNPDSGAVSDAETLDEFGDGDKLDSILGKFSSVVKCKSAIVKEKLTNYIKNEQQQATAERHVQSSDKGRRYRNMASVFTIDDDDDELGSVASSDDERRETVNLETWLKKPDVLHSFKCREIKQNGYVVPSWLLVTDNHLYVLRELADERGMALIQARRSLASIVKITSKKRHPELITFKYGTNDDDGLHITNFDRFLIPRAGDATKAIKIQIMKVLDALDS